MHRVKQRWKQHFFGIRADGRHTPFCDSSGQHAKGPDLFKEHDTCATQAAANKLRKKSRRPTGIKLRETRRNNGRMAKRTLSLPTCLWRRFGKSCASKLEKRRTLHAGLTSKARCTISTCSRSTTFQEPVRCFLRGTSPAQVGRVFYLEAHLHQNTFDCNSKCKRQAVVIHICRS